jgi:hypothetical protein
MSFFKYAIMEGTPLSTWSMFEVHERQPIIIVELRPYGHWLNSYAHSCRKRARLGQERIGVPGGHYYQGAGLYCWFFANSVR